MFLRSVYFEVHGCQMNTNDTEVAWAVLKGSGFDRARQPNEADVFFLVTCSIREGAENKIWRKLHHVSMMRKRGVYRYDVV